MPDVTLDPCPDTLEARQRLSGFLADRWPIPGAQMWEARLTHWWAANPAARENAIRGYWARSGDRIVGYGGCIPAEYAFEGRKLPALWGTSMVMEPESPGIAAKLFLKHRHLQRDHLICHSTPNPRVQTALLKMGARACTSVHRHFFAAGWISALRGRHWWPLIASGRTVITNPDHVTALARPWQRADRVEKWITPESLRWYCGSSMREHHFLGVTDAAGTLTSYLIVTPKSVKGLRMWDVIDAFSTEEDGHELSALMGVLVRDPDILPGGAAFVTTAAFEGDTRWDHAPALLRRAQRVNHFFLLPDALRHVPKHTVIAEGDWGL
ncbi:MAG: hypothetical protein JNG86_21895 [Verrucomicrobiaceae bacterium]|nr:hypothetical protein [Verrucomicrobiaceae bacterium]